MFFLNYLIDNGANIHDTTVNGENALLIAIFNGFNNIIDYLLSKGLTLNVKNKYKMGPLITAVNGGRIDTVKKIVKLIKETPNCKCNINDKEINGFSAYLLAVQSYHIDIVKYLASMECNINAITNQGESSFELVGDNDEMLNYLEDIKSLNSLQIATKNCFIESVDIVEEVQLNILKKVRNGIDKPVLDSALKIYKDCKDKHQKYNPYLYNMLTKGHMDWSPKRSYLFTKEYNNIVYLLLEYIQPKLYELSKIKKTKLQILPPEIWIYIIGFINKKSVIIC